mgnify:FL=1
MIKKYGLFIAIIVAVFLHVVSGINSIVFLAYMTALSFGISNYSKDYGFWSFTALTVLTGIMMGFDLFGIGSYLVYDLGLSITMEYIYPLLGLAVLIAWFLLPEKKERKVECSVYAIRGKPQKGKISLWIARQRELYLLKKKVKQEVKKKYSQEEKKRVDAYSKSGGLEAERQKLLKRQKHVR